MGDLAPWELLTCVALALSQLIWDKLTIGFRVFYTVLPKYGLISTIPFSPFVQQNLYNGCFYPSPGIRLCTHIALLV